VSPMWSTYRDLFRTPGAWQFSGATFLARLPIAVVMLGVVLYVAGTTGSYAQAGAMAGIFQICAAVGTIFTSRIIDKRGQRVTLPLLACLNSVGLVIFLYSKESLAFQIFGLALAGISQPALGAVVRTRWVYVLAHAPEKKRTAFAWESIIDELIFIVGPMFTVVVAVQIGLEFPIVISIVFMLTGSILLALQRKTEPPIHKYALPKANIFSHAGMWRMPVIGACFGWLFGSYEVTTVAFANEAGKPEMTGFILAVWAGCSAIGGLWFGHRAWNSTLQRQLVACTTIACLALIPAVFARSIPALFIATMLAGAALAPGLITTYSLTEQLIPANMLTEALTWTNSGMILGYAAGTAISGVVIDSIGTSASYILPAAGAFTAAVFALRATPRHSPSLHTN
jgi:predicted MFS family arabinose efflux permease